MSAHQVNAPATMDPVAVNRSSYGELFENEGLVQKVPTPPSSDDANKKLSAVQVTTPAAMFPVDLPHDNSEQLFDTDDSDEEDDLHKEDVIEKASSKGKYSIETSVFTLNDDVQKFKFFKMINENLYENAVRCGGQGIFRIQN